LAHTVIAILQAYVSNVNAAVAKFPELAGLGIEDLNRRVGMPHLPSDIATAVRNNGGGHWNHK
jgi:Fe-Mn family superoxide dismutase